jgi:tRNA(fMet)-specific endonuclease VapC
LCSTDIIVAEVLRKHLNTIDKLSKPNGTVDAIKCYSYLMKTIKDLSSMTMVNYDYAADLIFGKTQTVKGRPQHKDCRIAAVVLANNLVLVTRNLSDFCPLLDDWQIEDWECPDRGASRLEDFRSRGHVNLLNLTPESTPDR